MSQKKYLFITNTISSIGGGQIYLKDKTERLMREGWSVRIIFYQKEKVLLPSLKKFEEGFNLTLSYSFPVVTAKLRREITAFALNGEFFNSDGSISYFSPSEDELVIESYNFQSALWGEYIAGSVRAHHIFYLILENPGHLYRSQKEFSLFKLKHNLLYGIVPETIPGILPEAKGKQTTLTAVGCGVNPTTTTCDDQGLKTLPKENFTFICIGRFSKICVISAIRGIDRFCRKHPDKEFNLILIGDSRKRSIREKVSKMLKKIPNLHCWLPGCLYPIPEQIFRISDLAIESAGSARVTADNNVPTITVDSKDGMAIGIYRQTTNNRLHRDKDEPPVPIEILIERIYGNKNKKDKKSRTHSPVSSKDDDEIFRRHLEVIPTTPPEDREYFDVLSIKVSSFKSLLGWILLRIGQKRIVDNYKIRRMSK